jgi:hypothetical protein
MNHVAADDRVGAFDRPRMTADIERDRRPDILQAFRLDPRGNRRMHLRIRLARLPFERGQGSGKMRNMCCPVPLAISSTRPFFGSTRFSTSRIASLLRSAAGQ